MYNTPRTQYGAPILPYNGASSLVGGGVGGGGGQERNPYDGGSEFGGTPRDGDADYAESIEASESSESTGTHLGQRDFMIQMQLEREANQRLIKQLIESTAKPTASANAPFLVKYPETITGLKGTMQRRPCAATC